jgi:hypothetical protein
MRNLQKTLAFFGILVTGTIGQLAGCANDAGNCELNYEICPSATGGSSSGVIPPPPGCTDSPSKNADVIGTNCAYFVGGAKANDSNTGGEMDPFASLVKAVEAARTNKARVYVCGSVSERVDIPAGVSVFGGFDCTGDEWQYDATQPATIAPAAPAADAAFQASIRITGNGTTNIEDINIEAATAIFDGGSSIAVIVDQATVNLARANLTAGDGRNGAPGTTPTDDIGPANATDPAIVGEPGKNMCQGGSGGNPGGAAKTNALCPDAIGGKGGNGQEASGDPGADGLPVDATFGKGGIGGDVCMSGGNGAPGTDGKSGAGAVDPGTIDAKGYSGIAGMGGSKGTVGQGGGGGGGAKGKSMCYGASGGGGGAGGCPGNGGTGGSAGGSSIGIINLAGTLSFSTVMITLGSGGQGGNGGDGQLGGIGGSGGTAGLGGKDMGVTIPDACEGGNGGRGGSGGNGGGGYGGHSIGIAYKGASAPNTEGVNIQTGAAGIGGTGADAPGTGGNGIKANTQDLN